MQAYTHLVVGALCQRAAARRLRGPVALASGMAVAAVSHPFLDILSQLTYHPVGGSKQLGPTWLTYHSVAYALALAIAVRFRRDWPTMLAALWPDFDWLIRPLHVGWPEGLLRSLAFRLPVIREFLAVVEGQLPDWRAHVIAGLPELAAALATAWWLILREQRSAPAPVPRAAAAPGALPG